MSIQKSTDKDSNIEILRQFLIAIRYIQFNLALSNVWLRGGVSSGDAYFSSYENQIVGPAYIDAYNLENRIAVFPRVVVDSKLILELGCNSADSLIDNVNNKHAKKNGLSIDDRNVLFQWERSEYETVGMKKDVALFVDYLAPCFAKEEHLTKIVDNITENIYNNNRIYPKFRWLVEYMMSWCMPKNKIHKQLSHDLVDTQFYRLKYL